MIFRPLNIVGFVASALAGLHLYTTKHEAALLDRELSGIARSIDEANERTQTLQAEWAWLNEPERLRGVAQRHLSLEPMQPSQFIRLNEAERRVPAVAAYDGPTALFATREPTAPPGEAVSLALLPRIAPAVQLARAVPVEPAPAEPVALPLPPAAVPPPEPPAAPPITLELPEATPREAEPPVVVRAPAPAPHPAEPRTAVADIARASAPAPRPRPASRPTTDVAALPPIAAPRPAMPVVASAAPPAARRTVSSLGAPMVTQVATAAPRRAEPAPAAVGRSSLGGASVGGSALGGSPLGGSALGGSRPMLAPPVPFGSANAATLNGGGLR
jgi:hypothetical protein